jgi:hypothetical protein
LGDVLVENTYCLVHPGAWKADPKKFSGNRILLDRCVPREESSMSEPAGAEGSIQEFETEVFRALARTFEVRRRKVEESIQGAGAEYKNFEEARRQSSSRLNRSLSRSSSERRSLRGRP